ncbi:MAG: SpoIIE family protein phosphatase [Leptospiraceae bacterium]|nr:SpoIIE family protein phosphatase [Leptospiraceae bacterium]
MSTRKGTRSESAGWHVRMGIRAKITAILVLLSTLLCAALIAIAWWSLESSLHEQLRLRLRSIAGHGAARLDTRALSALQRGLRRPLSYLAARRAMQGPAYKTIARQLNEIVELENGLLLYAYIVYPTSDPEKAWIVADNSAQAEGDWLEEQLQQALAEGQSNLQLGRDQLTIPPGTRIHSPEYQQLLARAATIEEIWYHSLVDDISDFPVMMQALKERKILVEDELYYDPQGEVVGSKIEGIWSFSGYAPIFAPDGHFLGLLGVDITANAMKDRLLRTARQLILLAGIIIALAWISSIFLGGRLSQNIKNLSNAVQALDAKSPVPTLAIRSGDEIEDLGRSFVRMARTIQLYNQNLENMVTRRTRELDLANRELVSKNEQILASLDMARRLQQGLLPASGRSYANNRLLTGACYEAMESLGGDLYDVIPIQAHQYAFLIADVSGHGVASALITSMAKLSFHAHVSNLAGEQGTINCPNPALVLDQVNRDMFRLIGDLSHYLTALLMIVDLEKQELIYSNAGHHPAVLQRENRAELFELSSDGFFIGSMESIEYQNAFMELQHNDCIILYTDGILETRNSRDEMFGYERLYQCIQDHPGVRPDELAQTIMQTVEDFSGGASIEDDRAVLCIQINGSLSAEPRELC